MTCEEYVVSKLEKLERERAGLMTSVEYLERENDLLTCLIRKILGKYSDIDDKNRLWAGGHFTELTEEEADVVNTIMDWGVTDAEPNNQGECEDKRED